MPELERALQQLGRELEFPPAPELVGAVRRRLGERKRSWRRPLAIALAALVVGVGAALAVPQARTAILDWLGLRGISIQRVETLPPAPVVGNLQLGREVTLAEAKRRAPWLYTLTAKGVGPPDHVYDSTRIPGGEVSFLWGDLTHVRLLLTQFSGAVFINKLVGPGTNVEPVSVGDQGVWLSEPHVFLYRDRYGRVRESTSRLAAKTLLWQLGGVTLRLEGDLSKEEAIRIARSAR